MEIIYQIFLLHHLNVRKWFDKICQHFTANLAFDWNLVSSWTWNWTPCECLYIVVFLMPIFFEYSWNSQPKTLSAFWISLVDQDLKLIHLWMVEACPNEEENHVLVKVGWIIGGKWLLGDDTGKEEGSHKADQFLVENFTNIQRIWALR